MLTFSNTSIKTKLATAAVVAAGALALPAMASATPSATGCDSTPCEFVGGDGHDAVNDIGGATQFEINTSGPGTGGGADVTCTDSRATAVTDGSDTVTTQLTFDGCTAANGMFSAEVTCDSTDITIDDVTATGDAHGWLQLGFEDCEINVASGLCVINTSDETGGQPITLDATGADATGTGGLLTVPVADNTDALTFNADGLLCGFAGVPASGDATFSNSPNAGDIVYEEVGSDLHVGTLP
jgi:hypothetical protein